MTDLFSNFCYMPVVHPIVTAALSVCDECRQNARYTGHTYSCLRGPWGVSDQCVLNVSTAPDGYVSVLILHVCVSSSHAYVISYYFLTAMEASVALNSQKMFAWLHCLFMFASDTCQDLQGVSHTTCCCRSFGQQCLLAQRSWSNCQWPMQNA